MGSGGGGGIDWNPGNSSLFTGKGTPWGTTDTRMDMDPSHSSMNTGAGTPWGTPQNKMDMDITHSALNTGKGTIWGPGDPGSSAAPAAAPTTPGSPAPVLGARGGTMPSYGNNTAEESFRQSYLNSLQPNYGQAFQGQANKAVTVPTKAA